MCITVDLENPCTLSAPALRKAAARYGVSPIGTQDEILAELISALESQQQSGDNSKGPTATGPNGDAASYAVEIAREVLQLDEVDDYAGILNLAGGELLTAASPAAALRRAYLKLSLLLHPDKLQGKFEHATRAFQCLVRAYESLGNPNPGGEESGMASKSKSANVKTISRSNEGCFRTRVRCPRCKQAWSEGSLDGNPVRFLMQHDMAWFSCWYCIAQDYTYNFLMQGLKQYTCSTCLCEFGCMTALHSCPFCRGSFEYSPQDYHRKIRCGNSKCNHEFGFMLFPVSDRVMNDLRRTIKEEVESRTKARINKQVRAVPCPRLWF